MPGRSLRVLIVADSADETALLRTTLQSGGYTIEYEQVDAAHAMSGVLARAAWDIVIADYDMPHFSALDALTILRLRTTVVPFIIVSGSANEFLAVAALKVGADDYILKNNLTRLVPAVERALRDAETRYTRHAAEEALRHSEEQYRELVENANDIVFTIDLAGNFTSLNTAGEQISGYTREDVRSMNMAEVLAPESLSLAAQMIQAKLTDDRATVYELDVISRDGRRVPLEVSTRLIREGNKPVGVQGIARDVTERRRAAQALRESEQRYRGLFENASDIVYTHNLKGRFTEVNRATELLTGYTREEALQLLLTDVVAPEHLQLAHEMIEHKLTEGVPTTYELDIVTKRGRRVSLEVNSELIYEHGEPVGVQGIARDVTERRRQEAELRSRERKQAAVAELGQRALAGTDVDALFEDAAALVARTLNVPYSSILEYLADQHVLIGHTGYGWRDGLMGTMTVNDGPESQAGYALASGEPVIVTDLKSESRFSVPQVLWDHQVTSGLSVIIHGNAHPFGVLSVFTREPRAFAQDDAHFLQAVANVLTTAVERKRMEEERTRHSMELATRVLQAQEEERKRIARELHDETAQSLSTLLINLDLLEPHIPPDAGVLRAGFERVGALARRTLDETRALSHDLRPTILDDVGFIAAIQWFATECERNYGATVIVDASTVHDDVLSSEMELALFRIAQEALTNTGKHSGATQVRLTLTYPRGMARLEIKDNGSGFDPTQVSGPTREGRLGMYGMQERAVLLGGTLSVKSSQRHGTRIVVEIPLQPKLSTTSASRGADRS